MLSAHQGVDTVICNGEIIVRGTAASTRCRRARIARRPRARVARGAVLERDGVVPAVTWPMVA